MQQDTIRSTKKKDQTLSALAQKKLIQMAQQGETQPLNTASYYAGLLSNQPLKESMLKISSKTKPKYNLIQMKKNKFIQSWGQKIIKDGNNHKYYNFGCIPTSFFIEIGNAGIRTRDDYNRNFLLNHHKNKINSQKRLEYLGYYTGGIKGRIGYYHTNYLFLVGIFELGKHKKNILLNYVDTHEYNTNDRMDFNRNKLDIDNWFFLQEELCSCYGGQYMGRITHENICSLCRNSLQQPVHYMSKDQIIQTIQTRLRLKFTLILSID